MEAEKKIIEPIEHLSAHISSQIGIFFPKAQSRMLAKKLLPALPELGFKNIQECIDKLLNKRFTKAQQDILVKYLTIGETYFFRDKNAFTMLKEIILPEIKKRHQDIDRTLRIWSAACATGEEAYSLAILIKELLPENEKWDIRIIATDINPIFLKKAKEARYKAWSFRSLPQETIDRYFRKEEKGEVSLIPEIRSMVQFTPLNLVEGNYGGINSELKNLDLILCNNVLIYFSLEKIKATIRHLVSALGNEGWLYVSSVEVPFINDPHLIPISSNKATAFKKSSPVTIQKKESDYCVSPKIKESQVAALPKTPMTQEEFYECCLSMYKSGFYSEVIHQLTQALTPNQYQSPSIKKKLREVKLLVYALANQGKFGIAKNWCEAALAADKLDKELHYLYHAILQELGEEEKAMQSLRAALYVDPDMIAAHFSTGIHYLKKKDESSAKRHFDNALKHLKKMQSSDLVPGMENLSAGELNAIILQMQKEVGVDDGR